MAKFRKPSQRTIDIYNQLVEQQNKVRKTLIKMHKQAEEMLAVGRLPALVIPKRARKYRNVFYEGLSKAELRKRLKAFWNKYRLAKQMFSGGINTYLKEMVFKGYRQLWLDQIGVLPASYKEGGRFGRYTDYQIENSDMGKAMEVYNMLFTHGSDLFLALLYSDRITEFKYIYDDLVGKVEKNYYLDDQISKVEMFINSPKARMQLYDKLEEFTGYKHSKSVIRKANKKAKEDEEE